MFKHWVKPSFEDRRYGFEVSMYIYQKACNARSREKKISFAAHYRREAIKKIVSGLIACALLSPAYAIAQGIDIQNTRSFSGGPINASNVKNLSLGWVYQTTPDTGTSNAPLGSVSSTPAVKGKFLYFNDISGNITKLNRFTGAVVWKKNYVNDLSVPGFTVNQSRNTPYVIGNLVIVGSNVGVLAPLCKVTGGSPVANGCITGDGAIVLALDKMTGNVVWRAKADTHPASKVTGSISGSGGLIFVQVANWEEDWARAYPNIYQTDSNGNINPNSQYPCCSARGALVAMNISNGSILWKSYVTPGLGSDANDPNGALSPALQALLAPRGFFGASAYGHNPTIDTARNQIYITTAQNTTAPKVAEECEQYRRGTIPNPPVLPAGVTCSNLNDVLHNYASSVLAINMTTGKVNWVFHSRQYDAWNHACGAPDFYGYATLPVVFSVPGINNANCFQNPVGPDNGFGQTPMLVKNAQFPNGTMRDIVVVGNKDGRVFGLDPNTGNQIWMKVVDPGGLYGGLQFGRATDGKRVYFGTTNSSNINRDRTVPFLSASQFLHDYGFDTLNPPVRVGLYSQGDSLVFKDFPAPSSLAMPFIGPDFFYGINFYELNNPLYPANGILSESSGPRELWTLVNPPADAIPDGLTVFSSNTGNLTTIDGTITAVDAATGNIVWQRPAFDGIRGSMGPGQAFGTLTVGNGVLFIGLADGLGTMLALDANTGVRLFQFQNKIPVGSTFIPSGSIESGPQVVGRRVYWGAGAETLSYFPKRTGVASVQYVNGGNRLYMFILPNSSDDDRDTVDHDTTLDD